MKKSFILFIFLFSSLLSPSFVLANEVKPLDDYFAEDLKEEYWAYEDIDFFLALDVINGIKKDGKMYLYPNQNLTRAQFAKILVLALDLKQKEVQEAKSFSDVSSTSWYAPYVKTASSLGVINGNIDGTFRPNAFITRDQIAVMITRAMPRLMQNVSTRPSHFDDVSKNYWAYEEITFLNREQVISGYGNLFKPRSFATRAQALVILKRAMGKEAFDERDVNSGVNYITDWMTEFINRDNQLYKAQDFASIASHYEETTIGYYRSLSHYWLSQWTTLVNNGKKIDIVFPENINVDAQSVSHNFAIIEVSNFYYDYTVDGIAYKGHGNGLYFIKRYDDGTWKIFNYYEEEKNKTSIDLKLKS